MAIQAIPVQVAQKPSRLERIEHKELRNKAEGSILRLFSLPEMDRHLLELPAALLEILVLVVT